MPVRKCSNQKYRIGSGKCIYTSKKKADSAYRGYLGSKYAESQEHSKTTNETLFRSLWKKLLD